MDIPPDLFYELVNKSGKPLFVIHPESSQILHVNDAACEYLGYDFEELRQKRIRDIDTKIPEVIEWSRLIEEIRELDELTLYGEHLTASGDTINVQVEISYLNTGSDKYIIAYVTPLKEAKESQDELEEYFFRYDHFFHKSPLSLAILDITPLESTINDSPLTVNEPSDFSLKQLQQINELIEIVDVNDSMLDLFDVQSSSELMNSIDSMGGEDFTKVLKKILYDLSIGTQSGNELFKIEPPKGEVKHLRCEYEVKHTSENRTFMYITLENQTELREKEETLEKSIQDLKRSESRFNDIAENIEGVIFMFSGDWDELIYVNKKYEDLWGRPKRNLQDDPLDFLEPIHPEDQDRVKKTMRTLSNGERDQVEFRIKKSEDFTHWVWAQGVPILNKDGSVDRITGHVQEITERKHTEQDLKLFQRLVSQSTDQIYVIDAETAELLNVNKTAIEELKYPEEKLLDMQVMDIETEFETLEDWSNHVSNLSEGSTDLYTGKHRRSDGSTYPVEVNSNLIQENGRKYVLSVGRNITSRIKRDEKIRLYNRLVSQINDEIYVFDPETARILEVNDTVIERLGYTQDELIGESIFDIEEQFENKSEWDRRMEQLRETDSSRIEGVHRTREGETYPVEVSSSIIQEDNQEFLVSVARDITERMEAKKALEESEEKFLQLAENINQVFWLTDPEKEEIIYASPAYEEIWGASLEELYDNPTEFLEYIHPDDRERVERAMPKQINGEYDLEYRIVRPDGGIRWIHDRAFPVSDENGDVYRIAGLAEDITERKQLRKEREEFFDLTLDLFAITGPDGYFHEINRAFTDTLGYTTDQLMSKPFVRFIHPDDREKTVDAFKQLQIDNPVEGLETRFMTVDGEYRWLQWRITAHDDTYFAVARDITEEKRYQRELEEIQNDLEESLEEKVTLLEEVHHRVKNNLQVINSLLSMQARQVSSDSASEALQDSVNRVKSMALLHEKLYQSEHLSGVKFSEYVVELCEYLIDMHGFGSDRPSIEYNVENAEIALEKAISCGLIINELVSNALTHGLRDRSNGRVIVTFSIDDGIATLVVHDNGPGLSESVNIDDVDTTGMRVVKSLVEYELNGRLNFENSDGFRVEATFDLE